MTRKICLWNFLMISRLCTTEWLKCVAGCLHCQDPDSCQTNDHHEGCNQGHDKVNMVTNFLDAPAMSRGRMELPDNIGERVKVMMIPDSEATELRKEKVNSTTKLLVVTFSYKTLKCLLMEQHREMQEKYQVKLK